MDAGGRPQTVDMALMGSNGVVAVDASNFNYDQGLNILMADLDAQQIAQHPPRRWVKARRFIDTNRAGR